MSAAKKKKGKLREEFRERLHLLSQNDTLEDLEDSPCYAGLQQGDERQKEKPEVA